MHVEAYNEQGYLVGMFKTYVETTTYVDVVTDSGTVRVYADGSVYNPDTNEYME